MVKIDVFGSYSEVTERFVKGRTAVVIDVMRASTSIITALHNGCKAIIPADEVEEAVRLSQNIKNPNILKGGERDSQKIPGFDLGNSPLEYTSEAVQDKTVIMTTTNGTRAIRRAAGANVTLIGAFINATAVAREAIRPGADITIICAGTGNKLSADDIFAAGAIISRITDALGSSETDIDDLGNVALELYKKHSANLKRGLAFAKHYQLLIKNGMKDDVDFCLREDISNIVPYLNESVVQVYNN